MKNALDRLTDVQKLGINIKMFELAYNIVSTEKNPENICKAIERETRRLDIEFCALHLRVKGGREEGSKNLNADLTRYCKLAKSVM